MVRFQHFIIPFRCFFAPNAININYKRLNETLISSITDFLFSFNIFFIFFFFSINSLDASFSMNSIFPINSLTILKYFCFSFFCFLLYIPSLGVEQWSIDALLVQMRFIWSIQISMRLGVFLFEMIIRNKMIN